jgi:hypothetical protein
VLGNTSRYPPPQNDKPHRLKEDGP